VIDKFNAQPFQGRNLAVSEARAREDRPPGARPPSSGFGGPRPGGGGGFSPRPSGGGFGGPRPGGGGGFGGGGRVRRRHAGRTRRPRSLGELRTARAAQSGSAAARRPRNRNTARGPIKERSDGRIYAVDDLEDGEAIDFDDIATKAKEDKEAEDAAASDATGDQDTGADDQDDQDE